jgi:hypothetical protein
VKDLSLFKEAIKDRKQYAIYRAWASQMDFQRPLSVSPGTPKKRVEVLRKGLSETLRDTALYEAKKSKLMITAVSGEKTEELVNEIGSMPSDVRQQLAFFVRQKGK